MAPKNYAALSDNPDNVMFAAAGIATPQFNSVAGPEVPRWPGDTGAHLRAPEPYPQPPDDGSGKVVADEG